VTKQRPLSPWAILRWSVRPKILRNFCSVFYLQLQAEAINAPISDDPSPVPFTVEIGETAVSISNKLVEQGFITNPDLFRLFLRYNGLDASLEAGDYQLRRDMNMREIAAVLQKASFEEVSVTIPEGWRAEQVAELLSQEGIMDGALFLATVRQGTGVEHPLLAGRPAGASLRRLSLPRYVPFAGQRYPGRPDYPDAGQHGSQTAGQCS